MHRRHARRGALALGQLPINLVLPPSFPSGSIVSLRAALSSVLPRFVALSLTIPSLNASPFFPRSVDESLQSGALQLPAGTAVLVDESALGEGTLKDAGVRNVHALTKVINEQTLGYVFPFSSFEFETDLKVVVLSRGKSLLPVSSEVSSGLESVRRLIVWSAFCCAGRVHRASRPGHDSFSR